MRALKKGAGIVACSNPVNSPYHSKGKQTGIAFDEDVALTCLFGLWLHRSFCFLIIKLSQGLDFLARFFDDELAISLSTSRVSSRPLTDVVFLFLIFGLEEAALESRSERSRKMQSPFNVLS